MVTTTVEPAAACDDDTGAGGPADDPVLVGTGPTGVSELDCAAGVPEELSPAARVLVGMTLPLEA